MQKLLQVNILNKNSEIILNSEYDAQILVSEIVNIILSQYQTKIIKSIINKEYTFLHDNEQMFIIGECEKNIKSSEENIYLLIYRRLYEYIIEENIINLDGFVQFRLKEYYDILRDFVERSVNEYIINLEYEDFIKGLILYLEFQTPIVDTINVISLKNKFKITDLNEREILSLTGYDDILLDVIITLAPNKIIIYNPDNFKNKELLDTLLKIFKSRVLLLKNSYNSENYTSKVDKE